MEKYIGEYFLSIENEKINDNEFEDIVSELLNAIGFEVLKKGHSKKGEFCDGVIKFDDYAIVYDCKNSNNYMATAESNNTLKKYIDDEELRLKERNIYGAYITKSLNVNMGKRFLNIDKDFLYYLLYKKLVLGRNFDLSPLKILIKNKKDLTIENLENEF